MHFSGKWGMKKNLYLKPNEKTKLQWFILIEYFVLNQPQLMLKYHASLFYMHCYF